MSLKKHTRLQFPRGTTGQNNKYIGPNGEITVDATRKELRLHDGIKPGGHRIASLETLYSLFLSVDSEAANLDFNQNERGYIVRVSETEYAIRKFTAEDGVRIENPTGQAGNTTIGLPDRLQVYAAEVENLNNAEKSGFYYCKADAQNMPSEISGETYCSLIVTALSDNAASQFLVPFKDFSYAFVRHKTAGKWRDWLRLAPKTGTLEMLIKGTGQATMTYSPADLNEWLEKRVGELLDIDEDTNGDPTMFAQKQIHKFTEAAVSTYVTPSSVKKKVDDRFLITAAAFAGAIGNDNAAASYNISIYAEIGSRWELLATDRVFTTELNAAVQTGGANARFIFQSDKLLLCSEEWGITRTIDGEWTGRLKWIGPYEQSASFSGRVIRLRKYKPTA